MDENKDLLGQGQSPAEEELQEESHAMQEFTSEQAELVMEGGDLQPCETQELTEVFAQALLCERCGEQEKEKASPYCAECRQAMLHEKIGWESVVMATVFFAVSIFAAALLVVQWPVLISSLKGEYYSLQHRYVDAYQEFSEVENEVQTVNQKLWNRQLVFAGIKTDFRRVRMYAKATSVLSVGSYIQEKYDEATLKSFFYREMRGYAEEMGRYTKAFDAVKAIMQTYNQEDVSKLPYEEIAKKIDQLNEKEQKYSPLYLLYIQSMLAGATGQPNETKLALLKEIEKAAPKRLDLYVYEMINQYWEMGDTQQALVYSERLQRWNRNDDLPYQVKASHYLSQQDYAAVQEVIAQAEKDNPNSAVRAELQVELLRRQNKLDDAKKASDKAIEAQLDSAELYRQQAIVLLLQKKYTEAYEVMGSVIEQYDSEQQEPSNKMLYTWAICASLAEDGKKDYAEWKKSLTDNKTAVSEPMQAYIDGNKTVEDIFINGEGDVL